MAMRTTPRQPACQAAVTPVVGALRERFCKELRFSISDFRHSGKPKSPRAVGYTGMNDNLHQLALFLDAGRASVARKPNRTSVASAVGDLFEVEYPRLG